MRCSLVCALLVASVFSGTLLAQQPTGETLQLAQGLGPRAPEFFSVSEETHHRVDARNAAVLKERVSLDLANASLAEALSAIEHQTGVRLVYGADVDAAGARVTMRAADITLAAALTEVLLDAGVDVQVRPGGELGLVRRPGGRPAESSGQQGRRRLQGM